MNKEVNIESIIAENAELKKAIQLEAALERVRERTMLMKKSEELGDTSTVLFHQFQELGYDPERMSIGIFNEAKQILELSFTGKNKTENTSRFFEVPLNEPYVIHPCFDAWKKGESSLSIELKGNKLKEYSHFWEQPGLANAANFIPGKFVITFAFFSKGYLGFVSAEPLSKHIIELLERFAGVFDLIYMRFLDLQDAEKRVREANIETALEKVRTKAMSMHCSEDLKEPVAEVFDQLHKLDLGVLRCGIGIMNREQRCADVWVTTVTDSESAVQVYGNESFDIHPLLQRAFEDWLNQRESYYVLKGQDMINYYKALGGTNFHLPESQLKLCEAGEYEQHYYAAMFEAGGLFAFRESAFPEEAKAVIRRFAQVLNLTYKRFQDIQKAEQLAKEAQENAQKRLEDFEKLQEAKNKIEATLNELKSTQAQLIQSEKMASLGELTAGIAHEIQNPLNFVNNFSEINQELLAELKEELGKGNAATINEIADNLVENEKKISLHGKRADSIVKNMLQHSRQSSGQKEPTDINSLADEYLRLAYHGLRAKDKSFNADFKTDFDNTVGKVNVVPQELGRVLLNLLNNAFYAVLQEQKKNRPGYNPIVEVSTKKKAGKIFISVKDNGPGIPPGILNKIFQPFFTTKAAGEGTGLGLSMSYDIITKSHSGEIRVISQEGAGTEFIVELPVTVD